MAVPGAVIVRQKNEQISNIRDETDERLETEQVRHMGDISNQVNYLSVSITNYNYPPTASLRVLSHVNSPITTSSFFVVVINF